MTVNYLMVSSDDGQLPPLVMASSDDGQLPLVMVNYLLVMTVNYLMAISSDDGQLPHGFCQLPHGF